VPEKIAPPDDGRQGVVLLVEDDPDVAAYTGLVLRRLAGARVIDAASADAALAALAAEDVDVVITDIDLLPGANGLELTGIVRERFPLLPVVVLSGHATFDHAVVAMRAGAAEFLAKPVDPDRLTTVATAMVAQHRRQVAAASVSVLAISAHPDDAEIGIGATLAKHVRQGHAVTMTLSGGAALIACTSPDRGELPRVVDR
jgi:DNA-binding NtrC family response regulator